MEESLVVLAKTFNWEIPYYENRKVAKTRPKVEPREIEMIRERNQLDLDLHQFGQQPFETKLAQKEQSTVGAERFLITKIASAV